MRRALDGRADEVCVPLLLSAALGGARVRAPPACSRLRACDYSRLHGECARRYAEGCAHEQAAGAACADGAGLGQQWPGVALLRRAASAVNSIKVPSVCLFLRAMLAQKQSEESEEEQEVFLVACSYAVKKRRLEEQLARSFAVGARLFLDAYVKYRGGFIGGRRQQGGDRQVWMAIARSVHTDLPVLPPPQRTCI